MFKPILSVFFFVLSTCSFASSPQVFDRSEANYLTLIEELSISPQWLALLHIKNKSAKSSFISYVDDEKFFLSKGDFNVRNELLATIKELRNKPSLQCRFPARTTWLINNLAEFNHELTLATCDEYSQWRKKLNTDKVVLSFAAAQLNSPSSMYGHTFLRFDPPDVSNNSTYLSYALNFGANVSGDDGGFLYALKGLTGGYPGTFSANPYFQKIKEYNRVENRDIWEYQLNLTTEEVDYMLMHIWELKEIKFDYYFFDENCSFRLLELLAVARPGNNQILEQFPIVAIPLDTIRVVGDAGFIDNVHYRPSILAELKHQVQQLSDQEKSLAFALAKNEKALNSSAYIALSAERQALVTDTAYRYLRYSNTFTQRTKATSRRSYQLLKAINQQKNALVIPPIPKPTRPDSGHQTALLSLSLGQQDKVNYLDFQYRGSYHDLLDPQQGYYSDMSLNMVKIIGRVYDDGEFKLQEAQLLDIVSLSNRDEFIKPWSWKVNVSAEQKFTSKREELVTQGTAGAGVSYKVFDKTTFFTLATARLELNYKFDHKMSLAPGIHTGLLHHWEQGVTLIDFEYYQFIGEVYRAQIKAEQSYTLSPDNSLRLSYRYNQIEDVNFNDIQLEYRHYY